MTSDGCPTPPGATGDGCVVLRRLSRLEAAGGGTTSTGTETVLVEDWCQQYPSHSVGTIAFGTDGALYASGGDGASFNFVDYGQDGAPLNPCGDPPGGAGAVLAPPTAEGGALRSQDLRTSGDPVRPRRRRHPDQPRHRRRRSRTTRSPRTPTPTPAASSPTACAIPSGSACGPAPTRSGSATSGWNDWEEINRIADAERLRRRELRLAVLRGQSAAGRGTTPPTSTSARTCTGRPARPRTPYFAYHHSDKVVAGESCPGGQLVLVGSRVLLVLERPVSRGLSRAPSSSPTIRGTASG